MERKQLYFYQVLFKFENSVYLLTRRRILGSVTPTKIDQRVKRHLKET